MRNMARTALLCLLAGTGFTTLRAQVDPHFSQYYVIPHGSTRRLPAHSM